MVEGKNATEGGEGCQFDDIASGHKRVERHEGTEVCRHEGSDREGQWHEGEGLTMILTLYGSEGTEPV